MENKFLECDLIWFDVLALDKRLKDRLHLNTEEIELTQEDIELINTGVKVDLEKLKEMVDKCGFNTNSIENEIGISRAHWSMVFGSSERKNKRGIRMRMVVAIMNAIRRRKVTDSFRPIFITKEDAKSNN
jgi:hypothetical protein|nr:MAG TPA: hypothetical protein [Caudoviricetes sp.]